MLETVGVLAVALQRVRSLTQNCRDIINRSMLVYTKAGRAVGKQRGSNHNSQETQSVRCTLWEMLP